MAKNTGTNVHAEIARHFQAIADLYSGMGNVPEPPKKATVVEDDDDSSEEVELTEERVEEAIAGGLKELRALAREVGIETNKKAEIIDQLNEMLDDDDDDDDDGEDIEEVDDDEYDDDDDDDDEEITREDMEEMDLRELRKLARENGFTASDYRSMDQDEIIDLILGEDDEDAEDEDEGEDDVDEDEEVEELDEDALEAMTQRDLIVLAGDVDVKVPAKLKKNSKANKRALIDLILDAGEE